MQDSPPINITEFRSRLDNPPPGIDNIAPFIQKAMIIQTKAGNLEGILCKGLDPHIGYTSLQNYLIAGRVPASSKESYTEEWVIGACLAKSLSLTLGDDVIIRTIEPKGRYRKLKIVGIYHTYLELETHVAFCDMRLLQRLNNWRPEYVSGYEIYLKNDIKITQKLRKTILEWMGHGLRITRIDRKYSIFYDWLTIIQFNTIMFIFFILFIAGFTMAATIMVQSIERSYMINLLHKLGAYRWQIMSILLLHGYRTLYSGMLYGNILGIGLCLLQAQYKIIPLEPALYCINHLPIYWDIASILFLDVCMLSFMSLVLLCTTLFLTRN